MQCVPILAAKRNQSRNCFCGIDDDDDDDDDDVFLYIAASSKIDQIFSKTHTHILYGKMIATMKTAF
jgi:hypothetical protein